MIEETVPEEKATEENVSQISSERVSVSEQDLSISDPLARRKKIFFCIYVVAVCSLIISSFATFGFLLQDFFEFTALQKDYQLVIREYEEKSRNLESDYKRRDASLRQSHEQRIKEFEADFSKLKQAHYNQLIVFSNLNSRVIEREVFIQGQQEAVDKQSLLLSKLKKLTETVQAKESEIRESQKQIDSLGAEVLVLRGTKESEAKEFKKIKDSNNAYADESRAKIERLDAYIRNLSKKEHDCELNIEKLKGELALLQERTSACQLELTKYESKILTASNRLENIMVRIHDAQETEETLRVVKQEILLKRAEAAECAKELFELKREIEMKKKQFESIKSSSAPLIDADKKEGGHV